MNKAIIKLLKNDKQLVEKIRNADDFKEQFIGLSKFCDLQELINIFGLGKKVSPKNDRELNKQLTMAAQNGDLEEVKCLCQNGADLTFDNNEAICRAAENGHLDIVKYLHRNNADLTAKNNRSIQLAAYGGYLPVVEYLHQNGADVNVRNNWAIKMAAKNKHTNVVVYLLKVGNYTVEEIKKYLNM